MLSQMDTKVSLAVKVLWKCISLIYFRVYLEVNVHKNPTCISYWSVRRNRLVEGVPSMRIDAYNQITKLYKTNKTGKVVNVSSVASARDEVQISSAGRDYQIAKQAVQEASDIRMDKVAELKAKVNAGNYQVDNGDFASKLLAKYNARQ